jgi:hypothetical protein
VVGGDEQADQHPDQSSALCVETGGGAGLGQAAQGQHQVLPGVVWGARTRSWVADQR